MKLTRFGLVKIIVTLFFISDFFQSFCLTNDIIILNTIFKYVAALLSLIYFMYFVIRKLTTKRLIIEIFIGICILYTSFVTHNFSYFIIFCMMIIADRIDLNKYVRYIIKCIFIEIIVSACFWGIGQIIDLGIPFWFNAEEKRISLGFNHANALAMKIIWCSFGWILFYKWNKKKEQILIYCIINTIGFILTNSSTFIFSFIILPVYILSLKNKGINILFNISKLIFPLSSIFVYFISIMRNNLMSKIGILSVMVDKLSNYRISMSYLAIKNNGLTLLGQVTQFKHDYEDNFNFGNYTIDNIYTYFFVSIGVVWLILISVGFFELSKKHNDLISLSIIMFSLCGMAELDVLYPTNCYALILLSTFFVREKYHHKEGNDSYFFGV